MDNGSSNMEVIHIVPSDAGYTVLIHHLFYNIHVLSMVRLGSVSYTHLDVYKRQSIRGIVFSNRPVIDKHIGSTNKYDHNDQHQIIIHDFTAKALRFIPHASPPSQGKRHRFSNYPGSQA